MKWVLFSKKGKVVKIKIEKINLNISLSCQDKTQNIH